MVACGQRRRGVPRETRLFYYRTKEVQDYLKALAEEIGDQGVKMRLATDQTAKSPLASDQVANLQLGIDNILFTATVSYLDPVHGSPTEKMVGDVTNVRFLLEALRECVSK